MSERYDLVILGLSFSSSWGNGHATTFRSLVKGLAARGRRVLFLEREQPWYARHRDLAHPAHCDLRIYRSRAELEECHLRAVRDARAVIVGSFVPEGIGIGSWVCATARGTRAFYDIDTPLTLSMLDENRCTYLSTTLIPQFDLYLSFTGGPTLKWLESRFQARRAAALYCSVDIDEYRPVPPQSPPLDLGYLGTYSADRQPKLESLLLEPARRAPYLRFGVAGAQYPAQVSWPPNVHHVDHLAPRKHASFYAAQRFTLNITRADMARVGYSPSVRLFEAGACATPVISDAWPGLEEFFEPGREILLARASDEAESILRRTPEARRRAIGNAARERVLSEHAGSCRAAELEELLGLGRRRVSVA